jgi:hypothetical protein
VEDVAQPANVYPDLLKAFVVRAFDVPYTWLELAVVPVPLFALYETVYVMGFQTAYRVMDEPVVTSVTLWPLSYTFAPVADVSQPPKV